jgi:hypothetical protein
MHSILTIPDFVPAPTSSWSSATSVVRANISILIPDQSGRAREVATVGAHDDQ